HFPLTLLLAILINATLSVRLNESTEVATKHTAHTVNAALNSSVIHSMDRLLANSTRPLRAHNRFATRQRNTRTTRRVYKVVRVTTRRTARPNTTLSILAQLSQRDRRKLVQAHKTGHRVPCLTDTVIVNRLHDEFYRLRSSGPNAIPNISNSINSRLKPAPDLIKATPDSVKYVLANPHPTSVKMVPKPVPHRGNAIHNILEESTKPFQCSLKRIDYSISNHVPNSDQHIL